MTYIPISAQERDAMLETVGVKSLEDLFAAVPAEASVSQARPSACPDGNGGRCPTGGDRRRQRAYALGPGFLSGRGVLQSLHPRGRGSHPPSGRVLHCLHALSAGDLTGHAPVHLRVSIPDGGPHRHGGLQRLPLRRRHGRGRGRQHGLRPVSAASGARWWSRPPSIRNTGP